MKLKTLAQILTISALTATALIGCSAERVEKLQKSIQAIQGDTVKREQYPFKGQMGNIERQYTQKVNLQPPNTKASPSNLPKIHGLLSQSIE